MCGDPKDMMMAGAGAQGLFQFLGGNQQSKAYKAQAQAQRDAAAQLERQREVMAQSAAMEKRNVQAKSDLVAGQNTAAYGAAGIDSTSGSGLDLLIANRSALRQDLGNIDFNLSEKDYETRQNIANYLHGAKVSDKAAKQVKNLSALQSIVGTAASMTAINSKYRTDKTNKKPTEDTKTPTTPTTTPNISINNGHYNNGFSFTNSWRSGNFKNCPTCGKSWF